MNSGTEKCLSFLGWLHRRFLNCHTKASVPSISTFHDLDVSITLQNELPPHPSHNPFRLLWTLDLQSPTSMKTLGILRFFHLFYPSPYCRLGGVEFPLKSFL